MRGRAPEGPVMRVTNAAIAAAFDEFADRLELQEANPFRVRACRNAARTAETLTDAVRAKLARGEALSGVLGIGANLGSKVAQIATRGSCTLLDQLRTAMPPAITGLLAMPGPGPKRVRALWQASVHATVGLPPIPPELREDRGEIDAGRTRRRSS